ncbi:MAG: hypothetical protein N4A38_00440 [Candidatus Gracilibacteria bacterium]|nr:hypothetical protein [Candidatus Gracilibacteria bacterium]
MYNNSEEKVILTKKCKFCNAEFDITNKDEEFYKKISPVFKGKRYNIPSPALCPDCRSQRRFSFRNERKLYKRDCDATGKPIISIYSPDKDFTVYESKEWWTDKWNALDYGENFDFNKSFFKQFKDLMKKVPQINLHNQNSENSSYANFAADLKNCYLVFGCHWAEDCIYGNFYINTKNSTDSFRLFDSEYCYECSICYNVYKCFFLENSKNCQNCFLGYDLENCEHCIGCAGLRYKKYCIFNKQYTKQEYEAKKEELKLGNYSNLEEVKKIFNKVKLKTPRKNLNITNSKNCTGDDINNSKNISNCFSVEEYQNSKHCYIGGRTKDSQDLSFGGKGELFYEGVSVQLDSYKVIFSTFCNYCNNIYYCQNCYYCENCFGCSGLKNKKYCILNKQYTKDEYEELIPKIIAYMEKLGEWGEFFSSNLSPFGYNETVANEYYPETKQSAKRKGLNWSDYEADIPKVEKIIPAEKLPENIEEIPDDILNWALKCSITNRPYRIIAQELDFYRKFNLPIPKKHPDQRHKERLGERNPRKIFDRNCDKCGRDIQTSYPENSPEIVYCEDCYNKTFN